MRWNVRASIMRQKESVFVEISALNPELTVDPDREREIDPESDPLTVRQLLRLSDGRIVAVLSKGLSEDTCVYI